MFWPSASTSSSSWFSWTRISLHRCCCIKVTRSQASGRSPPLPGPPSPDWGSSSSPLFFQDPEGSILARPSCTPSTASLPGSASCSPSPLQLPRLRHSSYHCHQMWRGMIKTPETVWVFSNVIIKHFY